MGRGDGVIVRKTSIQLFFVAPGLGRRKETIMVNGEPIKPTPPNIAYARRLSAEIRQKIALGTFCLHEYFPHSRAVQAQDIATFGRRADQWLASKGQLAPATRDQYATAARFWKGLLGAGTPIAEITHADLAAAIGGHNWPSAKLHNNYLIALRGIFGLEYHGRRAVEDPTIGLGNLRVVKKLPDPLTAAERDAILEDLRKHYDARAYAYFLFAFHTGMRPEEIIALRWEDIDTTTRSAHIQRVRTFKGSERDGTKTHANRIVELGSEAMRALGIMEPFTKMKATDIFENPVTGKPWHDERSQRDHYWKPALRRLGIRARRSYCTRHTFATVGLMAGVNPAYIAGQLGHSVKMLLERYARWIPGADGGHEREKMEAALAASSLKVIRPSQAKTENRKKSNGGNELLHMPVGRRDWTRTNDPHHVKVVL